LFTLAEYHRMAETGILSPDERVELFRGSVREMSPKNRLHVIAVGRAQKALAHALEGRASVYQEAPLALRELRSEPEPDLLVCSNPDLDAYGTDATIPLLVVEVADSSLRYDVEHKTRLYAEAGIPEYWVVNLVDNVLVVFREPTHGDYRYRCSLGLGDHVTPVSWTGTVEVEVEVEVEVASLFPAECSGQ
jgi:Uma2 family endonuclease